MMTQRAERGVEGLLAALAATALLVGGLATVGPWGRAGGLGGRMPVPSWSGDRTRVTLDLGDGDALQEPVGARETGDGAPPARVRGDAGETTAARFPGAGHVARPSRPAAPPISPWSPWWPWTLAGLAAAALAGAGLGWLARRLRRESEHAHQLEIEVGERTRELEARNRDLQRAIAALEEASVTDPMTGLRNRRFLAQMMESVAALVRRRSHDRREGSPSSRLVFVMVDLDGLKELNDTHGHAVGDAAILAVRDLLLETCRRSDTVVRLGGDEFLIVGRDADAEAPERLAERLRRRVEGYRLRHDDLELPLSCSIGFAFFPLFSAAPGLLSWERCLTLADRALYAAKASGGNTWVGLVGADAPRPGERAKGTFRNVVGLVESGAVTVRTSLADPREVAWRASGADRRRSRAAWPRPSAASPPSPPALRAGGGGSAG